MVLNDLGLGRLPELLDSGGIIARRVIQISDRDADMGAMFARHVLWKQHERCGDGTVTTGVMFQVIFNEGLRYIFGGGNPMVLRARLNEGLELILGQLQGMTVHLEGKEALTRLAESICYDSELAKVLGEVFDIIGSYGRLEIRSGHTRQVEREYIEGMYWDSGFFSRDMADAFSVRANLENPAICMTNLEFNEPADFIPLLELALQHQIQSVLLTARSVTDRANAILLAKPNRDKVRVVVVKIPGARLDEQQAALEDMAVLTGGRPLLEETGSQFSSLALEDLGRARKAWAEKDFFGIAGGKGDARQLRQHLHALRAAYERENETDVRARLRERIGRLLGGAATIHIGGASPI
jgi:chaperonin GroEL